MPATASPRVGATGTQFLRGSEFFPDPFADYASTVMPESIPSMLRWCEFVYMRNGIYREALRRKIAYFITDLEISGEDVSREEKTKRRDFYQEKIDIKADVSVAGTNLGCYGNDFSSLHVPFRRYLSCPQCFTEFPLRTVYNTKDFSFQWSDYDFHATCPNCKTGSGYSGVFNHVDRRGGEESEVSVIHWDPHQIEIAYDVYSHKTAYIWKIPADYKEDVRKGLLITLENAPWEVIQAVKNDNAFMFDPDVIYHMKDEALAGIRNRGWGISQVITNFSQAWYVQVLHRYNEAIALDYVIPFRVITPAPRAGGADAASQDPVLGMNLGHFTSRVKAMLRNRKRDPAAWNVMPFPIEYQALGGEATQLAPKDLLDQGIDNLLSSAGIPPSMYKMDLTATNAPPALRLFEVYNAPLVHNLNGYLRWLDKKITDRFGWEPVQTRWKKVTHADDAQKQMAQLQLMMGRQISQTTGLKSIGLDFEDEQKGMLEEEKFIAEETEKMQEEMAESPGGQGQPAQGGAPAGGAPPAGGDPAAGGAPTAGGGAPPAGPPAGPNTPVSPQETLTKATQIAQQLAAMPDSQRQSELINLKKTDATLHAVVKSQLDGIRQDAQRQGGEQVMAQQLGKQGSAFPIAGLMDHLPTRQGRAIELDD
jgi:hypothetical protein